MKETQAVRALAINLARDHHLEDVKPIQVGLLAGRRKAEFYLGRLHRTLGSETFEKADQHRCAEWFLDNFYLIQRALAQVVKDMPPGFYTQLPVLGGGRFRRYPRIFALGRALLSMENAPFDLERIQTFVTAYQTEARLTSGELWALPCMLRLAALQGLLQTLGQLFDIEPKHRDLLGPYPEILPKPLATSVGNAVKSLIAIASFDWKDFFQNCSSVHRTLGEDPSGFYELMDFETADRYCKVVEIIAMGTGQDEDRVARTAVALAKRKREGPLAERMTHVGYFLVGEGRNLLEKECGCRPSFAVRSGRRLLAHPELVYFSSVSAVTLAVLAGLIGILHAAGASPWTCLALAGLGLVPSVSFAIHLVQWLITTLLDPQILCKLDFSKGIPDECKTAVVIPTLFGSLKEVHHLIDRLELHFLGNREKNLVFAILADFLDAKSKSLPADRVLLDRAEEGIHLLNRKYGDGKVGPFHLLVRERQWNPAEGIWMGWERKRGKLEEFNRLLTDRDTSGFAVHIGNAGGLEGIRFVITLDTDTDLPRATAQKLAGILAHPLNKCAFHPGTTVVAAGYTVVQPRVAVSPDSGHASPFTRIFAGDTALDIYTRACSDLYQDFFGTGIYVGKGIYEVRSFEWSLKGAVPENALLSHDLFEGIHGRAALATDVVLYEDYPTTYVTYARRLHRWIRGDWQLLPWMGMNGGEGRGELGFKKFAQIDRWKLLDNLRRSAHPPFLLGFLLCGWLCFPGSPSVWTLVALILSGGHLLTWLVSVLGAALSFRVDSFRNRMAEGSRLFARWALFLVFLPHEVIVIMDAIARTLFRLLVSRKHLLEWTTAAHTALALAKRNPHALVWWEMVGGPALSLLLSFLFFVKGVFPPVVCLPFMAVWFLSPEIAFRLARPAKIRIKRLGIEAERFLRLLARRTWLFFETFVGPDDQWLPPDNVQFSPKTEVAHRTSPTNIGLYLVSAVSAYDFGFIGAPGFVFRLRNTLETMAKLERHRGHLLNWYDTRTLAPLQPQYISTVDNGNLAACLLVLRQACGQIATQPMFRETRWRTLLDILDLLEETFIRGLSPGTKTVPVDLELRLSEVRTVVRAWIEANRTESPAAISAKPELEALHAQLLELVEKQGTQIKVEGIYEVGDWLEVFRQHWAGLMLEEEVFRGWRPLLFRSPPVAEAEGPLFEDWRSLRDCFPPDISLNALPAACDRSLTILTSMNQKAERIGQAAFSSFRQWAVDLERALTTAREHGRTLSEHLLSIGSLAEAEAENMDFSMLYDPAKNLFHIGYDASGAKLDPHHYDLLASEARLASFVAMALGQVPTTHWNFLGRPLVRFQGRLQLQSWSGTMFEYLMPTLMLYSHRDTLLAKSVGNAVKRQIAHGRHLKLPWGKSESGFFQRDADENYQYRAFGVPGLGLKRGLAEDLVVAPYASFLALSLFPGRVYRNLRRLVSLDALGEYGVYEAVDFTPSRIPPGKTHAVVDSYMAHHQGMILMSLNNYFHDSILVRRFHLDTNVRTVDRLLHERIPRVTRTKTPPEPPPETLINQRLPAIEAEAWSPEPGSDLDILHVLSNGRLRTVVSASGAGGLFWRDLAIVPWNRDPTFQDTGFWIYIRDEHSGNLWSATDQPLGAKPRASVTYWPHQVVFHRGVGPLSIHTEIWIAPEDDLEIRRVTLVNESDRVLTLSVTGYAALALDREADYFRHPAFSKLFVKSEYVETLNALWFQRRPRDPADRFPGVACFLVCPTGVAPHGFDTSRPEFLGRHGHPRHPNAMEREKILGGTEGNCLDPVMALGATLDLSPGQVKTLAFGTLVAPSRDQGLGTITRYGNQALLEDSLVGAARLGEEELRKLSLDGDSVPMLQRLVSAALLPIGPARPRVKGASRGVLWAQGISGDLPILLLRQGDGEETAVLESLVKAQRFWRQRGIEMDLVVLVTQATGYLAATGTQLSRLLQRLRVNHWLGRKGGIFLLYADYLANSDRERLEAAAARVFEAGAGPLTQQIPADRTPRRSLPRFLGSIRLSELPKSPSLPVGEPLRFDNGFGGFSHDGREYVIRMTGRKCPPAPWANIIANPNFGCLVTEWGLDCTWSENASENRLTPWSNDPLCDPPSEAVYLRDEETGLVWTPTPGPRRNKHAYLVRHGAGYSVFQHRGLGLDQELLVFVARTEPVKIVRITLENLWDRPRRLTLTYYAAWVLGTTRHENQAFIHTAYDPVSETLFAENAWNAELKDRVAFLASDRAPHGLTTDRADFFGKPGHFEIPDALRRWGFSGTLERDADPCAALQIHLEIPPKAKVSAQFFLGQGASLEEVRTLVRQFREPSRADREKSAVDGFWDEILDRVIVNTPEPSMNLMLNRWCLYQTLSSRIFGGMGFYQGGGAFGFRDQLQDIMALTFCAPEIARDHILRAASCQFAEGDVLHWWHPPNGRGVRTRCSDDLLWLPFAVCHYVAVTGDSAICEARLPFLEAEPLAEDELVRYSAFPRSRETHPLLEHCRRALEKGLTAGDHGLPLIGDGDWNDGMNRVGHGNRGESVWLAWFAAATLSRFAALCEDLGEAAEAETWRNREKTLRQAIENAAWDGQWYLRAFYDDGTPLGSRANRECRIDSISQSWAILSGAGNSDRSEAAIRAAAETLVRTEEKLVRLLWPPFDLEDKDPGYIRAYPPGIRENGAQYTHAAIWLAWAFAESGEGETAESLFRLLNPVLLTAEPTGLARYKLEPYVLAADIYSRQPHTGRGGWSWYTGSSAWYWRLGIEAILGIRFKKGALTLEPRIPAAWKHYEVTLKNGKAVYEIRVENPHGVTRGLAYLALDGNPLHTNRIPLQTTGLYTVLARLGPGDPELGRDAQARKKARPPKVGSMHSRVSQKPDPGDVWD